MSESRKIGVGWLAFGFVVVHFALIVLYALPNSLSNSSLKAFATPYVQPIFTQTWGMFAPCPKVNADVDVKFYFENDSTDWVNPIKDAAANHAIYRGSHHGELVLSVSNLYYWLSLDLKSMGVEIGDEFPQNRMSEFYEGMSYFKIRNFVRGFGWYLFDKPCDSALIKFYMEDVVTGNRGEIELPKYVFD